MENQNEIQNSNFNPTPHKSFWQKYGRGSLLILGAILVAAAILTTTGGFGKLASIFGIHAGTTETIDLFATNNLLGGTGATEPHIVTDTQATLSSVDVIDSADKIPAHDPAGIIIPIQRGDVSCLAVNDCGGPTEYISPALRLGDGTDYTFDTAKIMAYIPENTSMTFGYKTAATVADLAVAELHPIDAGFTVDDQSISNSNTAIALPVNQYLQVEVTFVGGSMFGAAAKPAVYGWSLDYTPVEPVVGGGDNGGNTGGNTGGGGDTGGDTGNSSITRAITLLYSQQYISHASSIQLIPADASQTTQLIAGPIDLTQADNYKFNADLPAGAYALTVTSSDFSEGVIPFLVGAGNTIELTMPHLSEVATTCPAPDQHNSTHTADLNGDGFVNSIDYNIFIGQYGANTAP